ncbi:MAG: class B sortase [Roseburia sp.]|nr:class B sortase [Roseburia sp.]MCM1097925.1 class B sortase [Ruminococcus flavefaciens]
MAKWIRRILLLILLAVFLFSIAYIAVIYYQYRANDRLYEEMAKQFTLPVSSPLPEQGGEGGQTADDGEAQPSGLPPISVDFEALKGLNEDIIGWLHCEGTVIDYPVLKGDNNDQYLRHNYAGERVSAGSIFVEEKNRENLEDSNIIIYGHHMRNGSMFACLDEYQEQDFYEEHPVMWLLTPEQDYRIRIFSAYTTSGYSDTYTIYMGPGDDLKEYLLNCLSQSVFQSEIDGKELDGRGKYVVLSTCAYDFEDARFVVHGIMEPVESAGGKPR